MMGVTRRAAAMGMALELEDKPAAIAAAAPKLKTRPTAALPPAASSSARKRPLNAPKGATDANAATTTGTTTTGTKATTGTAGTTGAPPAKSRRGRKRLLHDEEQRKTRRKLQCKLNQRRYRARQRDMISTLSLETETLQGRIQELEAYTDFLRAYFAAGDAALSVVGRARLVVAQFFRVFRHGFALHSVEASDVQERFLKQVAAPGADGSSNADALLLQLKRYSSYHSTFELLLDAATVVYDASSAGREASGRGDDDATDDDDVAVVIESRGSLRLRVSRDTVMLVYPHILADDALSARVVGCEIAPAFAAALHFDVRARLARLELRVDFCAAFVALLDSAEAAAALLGPALITRDCELGMDPQGALAQESALTRGGSKQLSLRFILL